MVIFALKSVIIIRAITIPIPHRCDTLAIVLTWRIFSTRVHIRFTFVPGLTFFRNAAVTSSVNTSLVGICAPAIIARGLTHIGTVQIIYETDKSKCKKPHNNNYFLFILYNVQLR